VDLARLLAESLRRLRQETGLNQKDLAKRLGVSHPTLHRLETGDHYTTLRVIEQLCRGLRCKPGDLFEPGRLRLPPRRSR
jgi:transcriptional regulator with XRE-family HTH domain